MCELGIAVNERSKDASGEWGDRVNFFNVTVWGAQGENVARYLKKGSPVAVDGRLRWEQWEKDGQKRSAVKVVADNVQFLPTRDRDGGGGGGGGRQHTGQAASGDTFAPSSSQQYDDDIPF